MTDPPSRPLDGRIALVTGGTRGLGRHIAAALDMDLEALLSESDAAADREPAKARRIALIGLRGAGKTTLGQLVASDLAMPFVELNSEIAQMSGLAVQEIFNLYGAEGYRRLERRCLQQVVERRDQVILATGGGIVTDPATYDLLLGSFFTVWLRARPEEHMERVRAQGDLRPMAGNPEAMAELKLILSRREPLYRRAERDLDTADRPLEACRRALVGLLGEVGFKPG